MKAPDKIFVEVCEDGIFAFPEPPFAESVEYIRADINKQPVEETPEPYTGIYDEAYLQDKIARATKSWKGVDTDKMLAECRGYEQPVKGLEEEIDACWQNWLSPSNQKEVEGVLPKTEFAMYARHFAEWGARHSINWGDVQLLDTFILELSREEKDGADWGDSEKFYTEVLRRFHEFNDKKIPEIVAEWEAEHLKR